MKKSKMLDLDYVKFYAKKLSENNSYFKQQKMLIDSQINASSLLFKKKFGQGNQFKINARKYLRLIKNL
ncbi:MAG: hypothetical protein AABX85_04295 [Nanoarchaeota archaeon]